MDGLCLALIWGKHYSEAIRLLEQSRDIRASKFGSTDVDTLVSLNSLGNVYMLERNSGKAIELLEKVRDERIKKLGAENVYTLDTLRLLASAYKDAGRAADAITILEHVRDIELQKLGPDDADMLLTMDGLGSAYQVAGRANDAVELLKQAQSRAVRKLGPDHAETLYIQDDLAEAYMSAGRWGDAITLLEQVRDRRLRTFGVEDFNTLSSEENLALCYRSAGRNEDEIAVLEQIRHVKARIFGSGNQSTLGTLGELASACAVAGHAEDGKAKFELLIAEATKTIAALEASNKSPVAPLSLRELAYRQLGRFKEAQSDLQALLRVVPKNHRARYVLACLQCYLDDHDGYRATCAQLLAVAKGTKDRSIAERTAKACLLAPDEVDDLESVMQFADFAVAGEHTPLLRYYNLTKGLAEYREGKIPEALVRLAKSREEFHPASPPQNMIGRAYIPECYATASFFLAMAQFRSGNVREAHEIFTVAAKEFASDVPAQSSAKPMVGNEDWFIAHVAFREAKGLLGE